MSRTNQPRSPTTPPAPLVARALLALAFGAGLALSACAGDEGVRPAGADAGADAGLGPDAAAAPDAGAADAGALASPCDDPALRPVPGGGVGGGPLRGRLVVFVHAAETGEPIAGARVVAQFDGATLAGATDARGCLTLADSSAFGAGRVHVFAEGRVYLSLLGFDAERVTVNLKPRVRAEEPAPATVRGAVSGFEVLTASTATIARVGYVEPIPTSVFAAIPEQTRRPENENVGSNVVVVGRNGALDFRDYLVRVTPFETAGLAVRAGTVRFPRFGAPTVELTHAGFLLGLEVQPGDTLTGKDLTLTHPLSEAMTLSFGTAPALPSLFAIGYVVLPGGLGWIYGDAAEGRGGGGVTALAGLPPLSGALAGASYGAVVEAVGDTGFSLRVEPGTASPHLDLGDLPPLPAAIRAEGRALTAAVNASSAELVLFSLADADGPLWTMAFVNTTPEPSITLPVPPEPFADPLDGPRSLTVARTRYEGVDLAAFSFADLSGEKIRAFSADTVPLAF